MSHGPSPAPLPTAADFAPDSYRGTEGFFRVGRTRTGTWWLVDPFGHGFFAKAVAGVNRTGRLGVRLPAASRYAERVVAQQGEDGPSFLRHAVARLRSWHFNTLGAWAEPDTAGDGLYFTEVLDFKRTGPCIRFLDMMLPDVFDPAWVLAVDARARELCAPLIANRELIGYFTDDGLGWAQEDGPAGGAKRPTLLQLCLSLEPGHCAYHAAWEFALAQNRGTVESLAKAWGKTWNNREAVRQLTVQEIPLEHPKYRAQCATFTREYARRYFSFTAGAIRAHDPNHLILGCRLDRFPGETVLQDYAYPHVDVVSLGAKDTQWRDAVDAAISRKEAPVWFVNATWSTSSFTHDEHLAVMTTPVERMIKTGRKAFRTLVGHRCTVGYEWETWADRETDAPPFGRGLVHLDDHAGREHTDLLTALNRHAEWDHGHGYKASRGDPDTEHEGFAGS